MAEIPFEALLLGLESTAGTGVEPTHYASLVGTLKPVKEWYRPDEARGTLVEAYRSKVAREWSEWSGDGPLDVYLLPVLLNMCVTGNMTGQPTTPGGATNSRLWTFKPAITTNDLKTATIFWGDRNVQMFEGRFGTIDELTITGDASSTDGSKIAVSGRTQMQDYDTYTISAISKANPAEVTIGTHSLLAGDKVRVVGGEMVELHDLVFTVADPAATTIDLAGINSTGYTTYVSGGTLEKVAPVFPAIAASPLVSGASMQMWLDTSSVIGTTAITGRLISAEHVIPVNYGYKHLAVGPTGALTYQRVGRGKRSITTRVTLELTDMEQYKLFENGTYSKLRIRHNGELIETGFYHYVQVDTYGPLNFTDWGELEGTNRTITLEIQSQYDSTLGADFQVLVQNDRTAL
jgi:hypothetical protein